MYCIDMLTEKGRAIQKLQLRTIWKKLKLTTEDGKPDLYEYISTAQGYELIFDLPVGLSPEDFIAKAEKIKFAFKAKDIEIGAVYSRMLIKVETFDGKRLL